MPFLWESGKVVVCLHIPHVLHILKTVDHEHVNWYVNR